MMQRLLTWWAWTARPFLAHPLETLRDWIDPTRHDIPLDWDELRHLTPEERKELLK